MSPRSQPTGQFVLLSNHGQALVAIAENPDARLREIAERIGITERATQSIVNDLVNAGYVTRTRVGRRNTYAVDPRQPFQHPALADGLIGSLISSLVPWKDGATAADPPMVATTTESPGRTVDPETGEGFDHLTALAAELLHAPTCFLSMVRDDIQIINSAVGLPENLVRRELPLNQSICQHVIASGQPLAITDAAAHPVANDHPRLAEIGLHSYLGLPLTTSTGTVIGTFCAADVRPRRWSKAEVQLLAGLAAAAAATATANNASRANRDTALRYRTLLDGLPETVILVFDRDLRVQVASGAALASNGYDPQTMIGRTLEDIVTTDQAEVLRPHYLAGLQGERHQFRHTTQAGSYTIEIVPVPDTDGRIGAVMAVGRNHLNLGTDGEWDAERLRALIENIPGAVYRCDADTDWRMQFISHQIQTITGYPASDFIDNHTRSFASIIHPEDREAVVKSVHDAVNRRRPFIIEYRIITSNGATQWVRERGQAVIVNDTVVHLDGAIFAIDPQSRRLAA
ncbi:MAG: PAS domain-containing protein [Gaiellales bacterium]|jgi:PAS domain S-box-containing protein